MLQVKSMRPEDFTFATQLANTMDWNMAPEDFQFAVDMEPNGCLIAFDDATPVGIATCISFGAVGWFGNLIVDPNSRRQGVGSQLVKSAVQYLQSRGVKTVGLYAYPNLTGFYGKLGFKPDEEFTVYSTGSLGFLPAVNLPRVEAAQFAEVEAFDAQCFGGSRQKLLQSILQDQDNLSFLMKEPGGVVGYVAATVYEPMAWVGPLICQKNRPDAALLLLQAALAELQGKKIYIVVPTKATALSNLLVECGFAVDFSVCRMYYGVPAGKSCIYVAESLERG